MLNVKALIAGMNLTIDTIIKDKIGRNDPCYCGSGIKYKKCGMVDKCIKKS